jgi:hypothetical protein
MTLVVPNSADITKVTRAADVEKIDAGGESADKRLRLALVGRGGEAAETQARRVSLARRGGRP